MTLGQTFRRVLLGAGVCAMLAGCYGDHSDLDRKIAEVKSRPGENIEPLPTIEQPEPFVYQAGELRDPFMGATQEPVLSAAVTGQAGGPRPDEFRRKEALESFELDSLDMVGTLVLDDALFGLVQDPDGLLYRVTEGNFLGRNHGRIQSIYDDRIELIELHPAGSDRWREQRARLSLED